MKKSAAESEQQEEGKEAQEWEDVEEEGKNGKAEQKVFILDQGFVGWQEKYGEDERLTEGYSKALWMDYDGY